MFTIPLVACVSSMDTSNGPDRVDGEILGRAFDAQDAISVTLPHTNGFEFQGPASFVMISDYAGACSLSLQRQTPDNGFAVVLGVEVVDALGTGSAPTAPGTFAVYRHLGAAPVTSVAQAYYGSTDKSVAYMGVGGSVTVTNIAADGGLDGTFDIMLSCSSFSSCAGPDAHLSGAFSSAPCALTSI